MTLQSLPIRRLTLGKEAGVIFTVLIVVWLSSRGELNPLGLLFVYLSAVAFTGLYFLVESVRQR